MAEATFVQPDRMGGPALTAMESFGNTQSLMQRATKMRWEDEDRQREIEKWQLMKPAIEAKTLADQLQAQSALQNFQQMQKLRQKFGAESAMMQKEFEDAMQLASYDEQQSALAKVQQKYAWASLLPEAKPFIDGVNNQRLQAAQYAMADYELNNRLELVKEQGGMRLAEIEAKGSEDRATEKVRGDNAKERAKIYAEAKSKPLNDVEKIESLRTKLQEAEAEGDEDLAGYLRNRLTRITQPTQSTSSSDAFKQWLGIGDSPAAPTNSAAQQPAAAPVAKPQVAAASPAAKPTPAAKRYTVDQAKGTLTLSPGVKEPKDILAALQEAVDDGVIDAEAARKQLEQLGFKRK